MPGLGLGPPEPAGPAGRPPPGTRRHRRRSSAATGGRGRAGSGRAAGTRRAGPLRRGAATDAEGVVTGPRRARSGLGSARTGRCGPVGCLRGRRRLLDPLGRLGHGGRGLGRLRRRGLCRRGDRLGRHHGCGRALDHRLDRGRCLRPRSRLGRGGAAGGRRRGGRRHHAGGGGRRCDAVGAAVAVGGRTLLGRRLLQRGRRGRGGCRRGAAGATLGPAVGRLGEGLPHLAGNRRLDGRGGRLDELAEILELGEHILATDTELFCELVHSGLACHCSPHW